ncbi:HlyD family secretion protein [Caulobacter sp. S45]|uniref:HlyD family secretion protein n=1 Tax=Caulobacter sp. S45 TaxID=1641861 RepID=UPI00131A802B|nr:HlyD family secretion protein [Caulobacter sp. S45]
MSTATLAGPEQVQAPAKAPTRAKGASKASPRALIAVGAAALLFAAGAAYILAAKPSASTDDAYLHADSTTVAPKVRGLIAEILVRDNQVVKAGQPLIRIDPEEFDARVAAASADLQNAEANVSSAKAALVSLDAEEQLAGSQVRAAQTAIAASDAQNARASADQKRYDNLAGSGAVADHEVDVAHATAVAARSDADHSRAEFLVSRNQASVVQARRPNLQAALAQAIAGVARAKAALDLARQDQGHALIRAPIDGVVGDRQAQVGDYVQPGTRLLTLVPTQALYVTANFKETQTARMLVGQPATVKVDALAGRRLTGHVESFAPGSGSEFSLLPFEPGTGNFTKIVQRVPVRIHLDPGQSGLGRLRPGLSVTATVDLQSKDAPK